VAGPSDSVMWLRTVGYARHQQVALQCPPILARSAAGPRHSKGSVTQRGVCRDVACSRCLRRATRNRRGTNPPRISPSVRRRIWDRDKTARSFVPRLCEDSPWI